MVAELTEEEAARAGQHAAREEHESTASLPPTSSSRSRWTEVAWLGLVLGLALLIRLPILDTIPGNVTADEADNLQVAYRIHAGTGPGFFGFDWKPAPVFSVWLMTQVMEVAGWSIAGMRLTSAVLSVVALVPFYLLARRQCSALSSLGAALLLASSAWYVNFSRSGWENIHVAVFALGAAYCVLRGLESGRAPFWMLAGAFSALGLYGYFSGRASALALALFLPVALLAQRQSWRRVARGYLIMGAVAGVLFAPQALAIAQNADEFERRSRTVYILRDVRSPDEALVVLQSQATLIVRSFLLFDASVGVNSRYNAPGKGLLDPVAAALYVLGLLVSLRRWRDTALWWALLLAGIGAIQLLSRGTPDGARAVGYLPVMYLFAALGLDTLIRRFPQRVAVPGVVLLTTGVAIYNLVGYWSWISVPQTLRARAPAIELSQFAEWQSAQLAEAFAGRRGFNVTEWQAVRKEAVGTPSIAAPAAKPANEPPAVLASAINARRLELPAMVIATSPAVREPRGLAARVDGSLLVADPAARGAATISTAGSPHTLLELPQMAQEGIAPWDVAVEPGGTAWVLDALSGAVHRVSLDGRHAGSVAERLGLYRPRGLAFGPDGHLLIADTGGNRIVEASIDGRARRIIGGGPTSQIQQPTDVVALPDGSLIVAEPEASRIQRLDRDGKPEAAIVLDRTNTIDASHLAFDDRLGLLLATDPARGRVLVLRPDLSALGYLDGGGSGPLSGPVGVAVRAGRAYVTETKAARIVAYDLTALPLQAPR